eukprot:1636362-Prymnesium_polylepis.1
MPVRGRLRRWSERRRARAKGRRLGARSPRRPRPRRRRRATARLAERVSWRHTATLRPTVSASASEGGALVAVGRARWACAFAVVSGSRARVQTRDDGRGPLLLHFPGFRGVMKVLFMEAIFVGAATGSRCTAYAHAIMTISYGMVAPFSRCVYTSHYTDVSATAVSCVWRVGLGMRYQVTSRFKAVAPVPRQGCTFSY